MMRDTKLKQGIRSADSLSVRIYAAESAGKIYRPPRNGNMFRIISGGRKAAGEKFLILPTLYVEGVVSRKYESPIYMLSIKGRKVLP